MKIHPNNRDHEIWLSQFDIQRATGIDPVTTFKESQPTQFKPGDRLDMNIAMPTWDGRDPDIRRISLSIDSNPFDKQGLRQKIQELPTTASTLSKEKRLELFDKVFPYLKFGVLPSKKDFVNARRKSASEDSYNGDIYAVVSPEIFKDKSLKKYEIVLLLGIISQECGAKTFIIPELKTRHLGPNANKLTIYGGSSVLQFLDFNGSYPETKRKDLIGGSHAQTLAQCGDLRVRARVCNGGPDAVLTYVNVPIHEYTEPELIESALGQLEELAGRDSKGGDLFINLGQKPDTRLTAFSPVGTVDELFDTYLDPETPTTIEEQIRNANWIWQRSNSPGQPRELILYSLGSGASKRSNRDGLIEQVKRRLIVRPSADGHNEINVRNFDPQTDADPSDAETPTVALHLA